MAYARYRFSHHIIYKSIKIHLYKMDLSNIRKNWTVYKSTIDDATYQQIWKSWAEKFNKSLNSRNVVLLKSFIEGSFRKLPKDTFRRRQCMDYRRKDNELILYGFDSRRRYKMHRLCNDLGLYHKSTSDDFDQRILHITIPNNWSWEYTPPEPESKPREYYDNLRKEKLAKKREEKKKSLSNKYCCMCDANAMYTDLYGSVYMSGLYCSDCLEDESDGEGGELLDHKFEMLY